ncbi:MAG: Zinc ribbon domain-containing protein [Oscillospiraceae bacterium]
MNYRAISCPYCGRELQVPEDATQIVCMFCAQPIMLEKPDEPSVQMGESVRLLPDEAFSTRVPLERLNAKNYPGIFESYRDVISPALLAYLEEEKAYGEPAAETFADALVEGFERIEKNIRASSAAAFDLRICITALTVPAILDLNTPAADHLADLFLKKWNEAHKQSLGKATYSTILNGFRKKLCFVTTAVCTQLGKGDNCEELQMLRAFRDGYLAKSPHGMQKINEYYLFAPMIVSAVERSGKAQEEWKRIYKSHLMPCISALKQQKPQICERLYENMMLELEHKWL